METAETVKPTLADADELTPRQIVGVLDRHIIGQEDAKKMVAIALRNRTRRKRLADDIRDEVNPKNIIMIGPTGVGKTEIARRLARLAKAPLVKVEASKYTEVGYVGRDVESMIRDLVETSIKIVREEKTETIREQAEKKARDKLIDLLTGRGGGLAGVRRIVAGFGAGATSTVEEPGGDEPPSRNETERRYDLGELNDQEVEIEVEARSQFDGMLGMVGVDETMMSSLRDMLDRTVPAKNKRIKMTVEEARKILVDQEIESLLDMDKVTREALDRAEQSGIVFIDEIDKIAGRGEGHGPDVSRQGVQRDILPIIEGCTVATKHGLIKTDHILFIAAGAFHMTKPSDLIPELQGRFPLRVELSSLTEDDFKRILIEPEHSLIEQYRALLETDGVELRFTDDAIEELASSASKINEQTEDIGARRLHTILERVLQEVSFDAPDEASGEVVVDRDYVVSRLDELMKDQDLSRFIL